MSQEHGSSGRKELNFFLFCVGSPQKLISLYSVGYFMHFCIQLCAHSTALVNDFCLSSFFVGIQTHLFMTWEYLFSFALWIFTTDYYVGVSTLWPTELFQLSLVWTPLDDWIALCPAIAILYVRSRVDKKLGFPLRLSGSGGSIYVYAYKYIYVWLVRRRFDAREKNINTKQLAELSCFLAKSRQQQAPHVANLAERGEFIGRQGGWGVCKASALPTAQRQ